MDYLRHKRASLSQIWSIYGLMLLLLGIFFWWIQTDKSTPEIQLRSLSQVAYFMLGIAALAGIAAMATVQFWKVVFVPRARFHYIQLINAFPESLHILVGTSEEQERSIQRGFLAALGLRFSDQLKDLLDNPTEVVMGQLRSSSDFIVLHPENRNGVLFELAGSNGREAVDRYLGLSNSPHAADVRRDELLSAVRFHVDQNLNLLHVRMRERWRRQVRLVAAAIATSVAGLLLVFADLSLALTISVMFAALVWGGFFAWFARDLVALIERRRS